MKILAIDSTGLMGTCAVVMEDSILCEFSTNHKLKHAETQLPMIQQMLDFVDEDIEDIDGIAVSIGPGSFTGLRIGIAAAKGLAMGAGKKIIPVSTLEALAYNASEGKLIVPIMDARRDQVYTALFSIDDKGELIRLSEDLALPFVELLDMVSEKEEKALFIGDATGIFKEEIIKNGHRIAPPHLNRQRAASLGSLAYKKYMEDESVLQDAKKIQATYIRPSQAEREYGKTGVKSE